MIHQKLCPTCQQPIAPVKHGILFDADEGIIRRAGCAPVVLPKTKIEIFRLLFRDFGKFVHIDTIWVALYGDRKDCDTPDSDNVVRVHVSQLRIQLAALGLGIDGRYHRGYRLELRPTQV